MSMEFARPYLEKIEKTLELPADSLSLAYYSPNTGGYDPLTAVSKDGFPQDGRYIAMVYKLTPVSNYSLVGMFRLQQFTGCCAYAISCNAVVYAKYRHKGVNTIALQLRMEIARKAGYTGLYATDVTGGFGLRTLIEAGFKELQATKNRRTNNVVHLMFKDLYQE